MLRFCASRMCHKRLNTLRFIRNCSTNSTSSKTSSMSNNSKRCSKNSKCSKMSNTSKNKNIEKYENISMIYIKLKFLYKFRVQFKSLNHNYFYKFILRKLLNIIIYSSHFATLFLETLSDISIDKSYCGGLLFGKT